MTGSLIERVRSAAGSYGVELEPDIQDANTTEGAVNALINMEWVATCMMTGETARGESAKAAWANVRGISKREVHNLMAQWHAERQ